MKKVLITVIGSQTDEFGEESRIELVSTGTSHEKNGVRYITYKDSAISGMEGTTTVLKLYDDHLTLLRMGSVEQKQEFYLGQRCYSTYITPFGNMKMCAITRHMEFASKGATSSVNVEYDLEVNGVWQSLNVLSVSIQEDD
jgi:uncharacterized beta-barrel protein YwiB (DUF1934 family)